MTPTRISALAAVQSVAIKLMSRSGLNKTGKIPLFAPPMVLHTRGASISNLYDDVFCARTYESPKPLPGAPRIVDAGAHVGLASLYFLTRYPASHVTAIEPNPNSAPLLRENLSAFGARAEVVEAALTLDDNPVTFHITADNPTNVTGGLSNRESGSRAVVTHTVNAVAATRLLERPVDLMKLDVEGHEYQLLELELFNPSHIANMVIEFHDIERDRARFDRTLARLAGRGYRIADTRNVALAPSDIERCGDCAVLKLF